MYLTLENTWRTFSLPRTLWPQYRSNDTFDLLVSNSIYLLKKKHEIWETSRSAFSPGLLCALEATHETRDRISRRVLNQNRARSKKNLIKIFVRKQTPRGKTIKYEVIGFLGLQQAIEGWIDWEALAFDKFATLGCLGFGARRQKEHKEIGLS